jgi:DNA gyrase subunit A
MEVFVGHRRDVTRKRVSFDLRKARERLHIVEGLIIALDRIDEVIATIRASSDPEAARTALMASFGLSELQAKAILDMRLQKLTSLESESVRKEGEELRLTIADLEDILGNPQRIDGIIVGELRALSDAYGDDRRTEIEVNAGEIDLEDLIKKRDVVITITNTGYIKRMDLDTYQTQGRGGKGLRGMTTKEEDYVYVNFACSSHDYIMFFTSAGRVFWLKAYNVPSGSRQSKGKALINLLPHLEVGESIRSTIPVPEFSEDRYLIFVTRNGLIKRTDLMQYSRPRARGIRALNLEDHDELVDTAICSDQDEVLLSTARGMANRFKVSDVRSVGRNAYGVIGMRLKVEGDRVVSMAIVPPSPDEGVAEEETEEVPAPSEEEDTTGEGPIVLTITKSGYGKRAYAYRYRLTRRGSAGVINIPRDYLEETGEVVRTMLEIPGSEVLLSSREGMVIRTETACIRLLNRAGKGVRVMKMEAPDEVCAASIIKEPLERSSEECGVVEHKEEV